MFKFPFKKLTNKGNRQLKKNFINFQQIKPNLVKTKIMKKMFSLKLHWKLPCFCVTPMSFMIALNVSFLC